MAREWDNHEGAPMRRRDRAIARRRARVLDKRVSLADYNFDHFRRRHLLADVRRTLQTSGIRPGAEAPRFELPRVDGAPVRLGDLRGKPVLLHFGSYS